MGVGGRDEKKKDLSGTKINHCELCGVRPGSYVVVNSISLAS